MAIIGILPLAGYQLLRMRRVASQAIHFGHTDIHKHRLIIPSWEASNFQGLQRRFPPFLLKTTAITPAAPVYPSFFREPPALFKQPRNFVIFPDADRLY